MAHEVFISHSLRNRPVANAVRSALERQGYACRVAPSVVLPGRSFADEVTSAINQSEAVVLVLSAESNNSEQIVREVQLAADAHLPIIQFRIEEVTPNDYLEPYLKSQRSIDATTPPLESHIPELERSLQRLFKNREKKKRKKERKERARLTHIPSPVTSAESPAQLPSPVAPAAVEASEQAGEQKDIPPASEPQDQASIAPSSLPTPSTSEEPAVVTAGPRRRRQVVLIGLAVVGAIGLGIWGYLTFYQEREFPQSNASPSPVGTLQEASPSVRKAPARTARFSGNNPGISFLNMTSIFKNYSKTKQAESEINGAREAARKEFEARGNTYKKALEEIDRLNSTLTGGGLSVDDMERLRHERDDKTAASKKFAQEVNDFRKVQQKQFEELAQKSRDRLLGEIMAAIRQLTGPGDSVVFDNSGMTSNGVPVILFSTASADMSERVLAKLNEGGDTHFASAHALPFAAVDMSLVFSSYGKTKEAEKKINETRDAAKKEYDDRADTYKKALEELNQMNQVLGSKGLTIENKVEKTRERDAKISQIKEMEREIQEFRITREKQLTEQAARVRTEIVNEITKVLAAKLPSGDVPVIIDKSGMSEDGIPIVVYAGTLPDLSNLVIATLNHSGPAGGAEGATPSFSSSDQIRFGFVDMRRIIKAMPEAIAPPGSEKDPKALAARKAATARKAVELVRSYAERNGSGVIFNATGNTLNLLPVPIMAEELPDLTDEVIAEIR
jgi:hypothetical protein